MTDERRPTGRDQEPPGDPAAPVARLERAFPAELRAGARHRHLAAMDDALGGSGRGGGAQGGSRWARRVGVALLASGLVFPVAAVASDDALPGEALYPVKRVTERVVAVFDPDVVAEHRVEEAEALVARTEQVLRDEVPVPDPDQARAADAAIDAVEATDDRSVEDDLRRRALLVAARLRDLHDFTADEVAALSDQQLRRLVEELRRRQRELAAARGRGDAPADDRPPPTRDEPTSSPSPTAIGSERPSDRPGDRPSDAPSQRPSEPSEKPTRDEPTGEQPSSRRERHEVGRAGIVVYDVTPRGIELVEVRVRDGWRFRADRSGEPDRIVVQFHEASQDRNVVFTARHIGRGEVETETREQPPPDRESSPPPSDQRTPQPSNEPSEPRSEERPRDDGDGASDRDDRRR